MNNRSKNTAMTSAIAASLLIRVTLLAQTGDYSQTVAQAQADLSVGRAAQVAAESRQAMILAPTGWQAYLIAGSALELERQYDQAIDNFTQALEYAPAANKDAVKGMLERCMRAQIAAQAAPAQGPPAAPEQPTQSAAATSILGTALSPAFGADPGAPAGDTASPSLDVTMKFIVDTANDLKVDNMSLDERGYYSEFFETFAASSPDRCALAWTQMNIDDAGAA